MDYSTDPFHIYLLTFPYNPHVLIKTTGLISIFSYKWTEHKVVIKYTNFSLYILCYILKSEDILFKITVASYKK